LSGSGGADKGSSLDAHYGGDQGTPLGTVERRSGDIDLDASVLLAISRPIAAVADSDRPGRCGNIFEAAQQVRLVVLDLDDQVIASRAGDLEGFFDSAWRRA
jgi:hypothetical protein